MTPNNDPRDRPARRPAKKIPGFRVRDLEIKLQTTPEPAGVTTGTPLQGRVIEVGPGCVTFQNPAGVTYVIPRDEESIQDAYAWAKIPREEWNPAYFQPEPSSTAEAPSQSFGDTLRDGLVPAAAGAAMSIDQLGQALQQALYRPGRLNGAPDPGQSPARYTRGFDPAYPDSTPPRVTTVASTNDRVVTMGGRKIGKMAQLQGELAVEPPRGRIVEIRPDSVIFQNPAGAVNYSLPRDRESIEGGYRWAKIPRAEWDDTLFQPEQLWSVPPDYRAAVAETQEEPPVATNPGWGVGYLADLPVQIMTPPKLGYGSLSVQALRSLPELDRWVGSTGFGSIWLLTLDLRPLKIEVVRLRAAVELLSADRSCWLSLRYVTGPRFELRPENVLDGPAALPAPAPTPERAPVALNRSRAFFLEA